MAKGPSERTPRAPRRLFSPSEADQLVPHLESAFGTIQHHRERLYAIVQELAGLGVDLGEEIPADQLERPEVGTLVQKAMHEHAQIRAELERLDSLEVEVKGLEGLCDVRSRHDGRVVYLCWRRGEPGFHHWHELDTGFAGRQRVMRKSDFEGTLLH
jgi:hypothetical protein